MANIIRDLAGSKYLEMQNGRFARLPLPALFMSGSWTKIRVALRMDVTGTASFTPTEFFFGLCSGTSNIPGDATTTNAIGARSKVAGNLSYSATAGAQQFYGEFLAYKSVGGTETAGTTFGNGVCGFNATANTNASGPSCGFFVTITKGSPNYTLDLFCIQPISSGGMTYAQFQTQSIASTPSLTGHSNITGKTIAFDQTAGTLDAAFIYWSDSLLLCVRDWRVILLA